MHTYAPIEFRFKGTREIAYGAASVTSIRYAPILAIVLHEGSSVQRPWHERVLAAPHLRKRRRNRQKRGAQCTPRVSRQKLGSQDLFWDARDVQLEINHLDVLWHTLAAATPSNVDGAGNI